MKSLKVFRNGVRLRDVYVGASKWQMFKFRLARFIRKVVIVISSFAAGYVLIVSGSTFFPQVVYSVQDKEVLVDNLGKKIEEIKQETLDTLQKCESAGYSEDDGIIIFDSNAKASVGQYQWQISSVQYYYQKLYGKKITKKEAALIALDTNKARSLAHDVIFKLGNGHKDWVNCFNKHNLQANVNLIKKLES